ncbi:hypothetical protein YPPY94_1401, partial [Yersinia pestis PY-94]
MHDNDGISS